MKAENILDILKLLEKLKNNTRHSWTSTGRKESIAKHCWRMAIFAFLIKTELQDLNNNKLLVMCLIHDFGEAITGDVPTFWKTKSDNQNEKVAVEQVLSMFEPELHYELKELFCELEENKTMEAKVCHALDKLECILQHNEADIETWLPLEYELQLSYGWKDSECVDALLEIRRTLANETKEKIKGSGSKKNG